MPYSGISNYHQAYKKAKLLIENLKLRADLSNDVQCPIRVLEVGSGYGEFARNFIRAFQNISIHEELNLENRLQFFLSDFSEKTLEELAASGRMEEEKDSVIYTIFDAADRDSLAVPGFAREKQKQLDEAIDNGFDLIVANYVLDQFPVRVFASDGKRYFEKYLRLEDKENRIEKFLNGKPENKWIKKIKKRIDFKEIEIQDTMPVLDLEILNTCFRDNGKISSASYPYAAKEVLLNFYSLLESRGLIICSDFNCSSKTGFDDLGPCYYGNSLAEGVNFDFMQKFFRLHETQLVLLYEDPIRPLHTLILAGPDFDQVIELGDAYKKVYLENWFLRFLYKFLRDMQIGSWIFAGLLFAFTILHLFGIG